MGIPTIIKLSGVSFCQDVINTLNEKDELLLELGFFTLENCEMVFRFSLSGWHWLERHPPSSSPSSPLSL